MLFGNIINSGFDILRERGRLMAEQFLTLMADLDDVSQEIMSGWYNALKETSFTGTQTPGIPYHISLATFPLEKEQEAVALMQKVAAEFARSGLKGKSQQWN